MTRAYVLQVKAVLSSFGRERQTTVGCTSN